MNEDLPTNLLCVSYALGGDVVGGSYIMMKDSTVVYSNKGIVRDKEGRRQGDGRWKVRNI